MSFARSLDISQPSVKNYMEIAEGTFLWRRLYKHKEFFYRTHNQAEIDLIVQGRFGLIPIEIKSGLSVKREQLIAMKNFIEEHNCCQ